MNNMFSTNLPMATPTACQVAPPTLQDLKAHVMYNSGIAVSTKDKYITAINKVATIRNEPLTKIPASLDLVNTVFPPDGFDPTYWKTEQAFLLFRRRLQAPLKDFLGVREALLRSRAQQDGWYHLIEACLEEAAGIPDLMSIHKTKFASLKLLADIARQEGIQPRDIDKGVAGVIYRAAPCGKRDTITKGLTLLDKLREYDIAVPFLPTHKVGFSAFHLRQQQNALPAQWQEEFELAYEMMNAQHFDPVAKKISKLSPNTKNLFMAAMRGLARTYIKAHPQIDQVESWINLCSVGDNVTALATLITDRCKLAEGAEDKILPRTARKYLLKLRQVLCEFAPDSTGLEKLIKILANNEILKKGKEADSEMTPKNIKFCQGLIDDKKLKTHFLTSYQIFYDEAVQMLADIEEQGRKLKPREKCRIRWLGTIAAFCALEFGGMPIRIKNAMGLTIFGVDAQIVMPKLNKKEIKVHIPKEQVKNKKSIDFTIKSHKNSYLEVLNWYVEVIRPMYQHADNNPFLIPATMSATKAMDESYFSEKFAGYTRSVLGLPMTPHQMRHGQVSLMIAKYPERILIIAHRIGDTLKTMFDYYGWMDEVRLIEEGQKMIAEMTDE